jgi:DNA-binding transcriptional regulator YiaG
MSHKTFMEKLKVTAAERAAFSHILAGQDGSAGGHNAKKAEWNVGAMGFAPMKDMAFDAYLAETKRRQALAGARSAEVRGAPANAKSQDLRAKAVLMRNSGLSTRAVANEIGVSQKTVSNWTRCE